MHVMLIGLVVAIFLHDELSLPLVEGVSAPVLAALWLAPKLLAAGAYGLLCLRSRQRLIGGDPMGVLRRLERLGLVYYIVLGLLYAADLSLGVLVMVRGWFSAWSPGTGGNVVLLDDVIFLLPTLLAVTWGWWCYYPIDRRLREASLIRRVDLGLPVSPLWTRGQFVLNQLRHQVALILIPLLLMIGWVELVESGPVRNMLPHVFGADPAPLVSLAGTVMVFLFAPVVIRHIWDTIPLPAGEVREHMLDLCRRHRVNVREVLVWRTAGGMINAAVMGLIAPLRYILLTDALLENVKRDEVEAVMAHELGHVRRHHMFWLVAAAVTGLGVLELFFTTIFFSALSGLMLLRDMVPATGTILREQWLESDHALLLPTLFCTFPAWVVLFGWVSRRAERQADTFAVQHLTQRMADDDADAESPPRVRPEAVATMVGALQRVADLNHMPVKRHNWRHGSIAWRQGYLRTLIGKPIDQLPIDRQMRHIKAATLVAILIIAATYGLFVQLEPRDTTQGYNPAPAPQRIAQHALHEDARHRE